jgi:hypothetical protein
MGELLPRIFAHGGGGGALPDHETLMLLMPALPVVFIAVVVIAKAFDRRSLLGRSESVAVLSAMDVIAVGLSLGAAAIHFAVLPEHMALDMGEGFAFLGLAWFQVLWPPVYLLARTRLIAGLGVVVNLGVIAVWAVSRTVGLPIGPTPWEAEAIGSLDLFATAFQIGLVAVLLPRVLPAKFEELSRRRLHREQAFVLAAFCVVTVALLATVALIGVPDVETAAAH